METPISESSTGQQPPAAKRVADEPVAEQIRLQADQLAGHLRRRQNELDHREAELNSRIARLESETRSARLWLSQRETDLASRGEEMAKQQEDLLRRQQEVEKRLARLAAAEAAQQRRRESPPCNGEALVSGENSSESILAARQRQLDEAEAKLAEAQAETEKLHNQLLSRQRAFAEEAAAIREQMPPNIGRRWPTWSGVAKPSNGGLTTWIAAVRRSGNSAPNWGTCTAKPWKSAWRRRNSGHSFPGPRRRPHSLNRWAASARSWPTNIARPMRSWPISGRNWKRSASS